MLADRLAALTEKFSRDRDRVYREQLQKIQVDTNLIMRVDAYAERPFDALEEEHRQLSQSNGDAENRPGPRTLLEMAGPRFQDWIHGLQDLVEERDYYLTKYMVSRSPALIALPWAKANKPLRQADFEKKAQEHGNTYRYKVETANREHRALSQTLRDRLMNAIAAKKFRLNKEKEALEIADASALLLHPNQFSLTNPASPGPHGKRATRLRRDMDEIPSLADNKKRKRNPGEDDGSPAPQRRALDTTNTTPLWQGDRLAMRKTTGPVYSIDKLFTDKELSMTYNAAAVAAHKHILLHKPTLDENGQLVSSPDGSDSGSGENDEQDGTDSLPSAVPMERNVSHATRSARGAPNFTDDKLLGLEALANFDFPQNLQKMLGADPKLPPTFPSTYVKGHTKQADFNTPMPLSADDAAADLTIISALKHYEQQHGKGSNLESPLGSRSILEAVAHPARENRYVAYLQADRRPAESDIRHRFGIPPDVELTFPKKPAAEVGGTPSKAVRSATPMQSPAKGFMGGGPTSAPTVQLSGVSMSRQSSASGAPMSRSSSRKGRATRAI
jgi:hypothetical protein